MNFSFLKLKELANLTPETKVEDVVNAINSIGFEVESYTKICDVEGIKFGKITKIYPNPNGDKLSVCEIQFHDKLRIIQTTAKNVKENTTIIAFVPGSKLRNITFESKVLKGINSEGMLCSLTELGFDENLLGNKYNDGINSYDVNDLTLDPIEYLELNDYIIDVSILSNRSDANAYLIMALELSAYFKTDKYILKSRESSFQTDLTVNEQNTKSLIMFETKTPINLSIQDELLLVKSGFKLVNNNVNIANLGVIMTGQPIHIYCRNQIGNNLKANYVSGNVNIFGNKEVELNDNLVISDENQVLALAGVIGLENLSVSEKENHLVVELGRFSNKDINHNIKSIKLNTFASSLSSKEIAIYASKLAYDFLSNYFKQISNPTREFIFEQKTINFNEENLFKLAGENIENNIHYKNAKNALNILGFNVNKNQISFPLYRHDLRTEQDFHEEIFRFYGYNHFNISRPNTFNLEPKSLNFDSQNISSLGYQEVLSYTLVSKEKNEFNPFKFDSKLELQTFVSTDHVFVRNSMWNSLDSIIEHNTKQKMPIINLFEQGMINEEKFSTILVSNRKSFSEMINDIQNILHTKVKLQRFNYSLVHPNISAKIMINDKMIGWIGKINPHYGKFDGLIAEFLTLELDKKITVKDYEQLPLKSRDITFEVSLQEDLAPIIEKIQTIEDIFAIEKIDNFVKDNIQKITLRIHGSDEAINILDKEYN